MGIQTKSGCRQEDNWHKVLPTSSVRRYCKLTLTPHGIPSMICYIACKCVCGNIYFIYISHIFHMYLYINTINFIYFLFCTFQSIPQKDFLLSLSISCDRYPLHLISDPYFKLMYHAYLIHSLIHSFIVNKHL